MEKLPWIEKYRPQTLQDLEQNEELLNIFARNIATHNITHQLFYGPPGTGKTSAILAMGRELFGTKYKSRVIEFNASDDRGINVVREKITKHASATASKTQDKNGKLVPGFKIIVLDEADAMTDEAQDALRVIIETYSHCTRFCFICNYLSKITQAIKSRCAIVNFKRLSTESILRRLMLIAQKESIIISEKVLQTINSIADGDMRKAIMMLQNCKSLQDYKNLMHKPLKDWTTIEMKTMHQCAQVSRVKLHITNKDIYHLAATISPKRALEFVYTILSCQSMKDIMSTIKTIYAMGYPMIHVMSQMTYIIHKHDILSNEQRASFFLRTAPIFMRMHQGANEYIQLCEFISILHQMTHS